MNEAFLKLEEEKKEKIRIAALREFAKQGYKNASTNVIVSNADIGKGMLFYYFNTKKGLFEYLIEFSLNFIETEMLGKIKYEEKDFILRMKNVAKVKFNAMKKNKHIFNFLATISINDRENIEPAIVTKIDEMSNQMIKKLYTNLDKILFRDDMSEDVVIKFIAWIIEGYQNELIQKLKGKVLEEVDMSVYWEEFDYYLEMIRIALYK